MRKNKRSFFGRLASFLLGFSLCLIGVIILLYMGFDTIKDISKSIIGDQKKESPTQKTNAQPTVTTQAETPSATAPSSATVPPSSVGANTDMPVNIDVPAGVLSEVHGTGGKGHLKAIPSQYTNKNELVHVNAYNPLMNLIADARNDGIHLTVFSAYRSYGHQKSIWERKWGDAPNDSTAAALDILRYSSFPGTSRHHWGTDIDFNSVSLSYWQSQEGRRVFQWLQNNARKYGFCQTYGAGRAYGYNDEPWHWSHIPTANRYYQQITQPAILNTALSQKIKGASAVRLLGSQLTQYTTGISPCSGVVDGGKHSPRLIQNEIMPDQAPVGIPSGKTKIPKPPLSERPPKLDDLYIPQYHVEPVQGLPEIHHHPAPPTIQKGGGFIRGKDKTIYIEGGGSTTTVPHGDGQFISSDP